MAQRIAIDCDPHLDRGEQVEGKPRLIAVDGQRAVAVDACDICDKEVLQPVRDLIAEHGRALDDEELAVLAPKQPTVLPKHVCPVSQCGYRATRGAIRSHIRDSHEETTLAHEEARLGHTLDGLPIEHHCACGGGFSHLQGLRRHQDTCRETKRRAKKAAPKQRQETLT